ncbi:MAG: cytidylate kinase [Candidatus Paraimprobicoccus trichonymphae]|uniref:Cytidylate kinase n=1 Tax=Candidatus Paraimprobicoccus trichonymphae TaxID=3033793 RepID=A0AA48KZC0_9FIRM|nr:MAG: cytidylate kinase [Candidatus Paraimprobicoccus trichonymphae]
MISIAIDGPAGAGKSTISKILAEKLNFIYLDTGALYRSIAYYLVSNNLNYENMEILSSNLKHIKIFFKNNNVFLGSENITKKIRENNISSIASKISNFKIIRDFLLGTQRDFAKNNNTIMDGRDIGTVILPFANIKIFLTATVEARAQRRYKEFLDKKNFNINYEEVLKTIKQRDFNDSHRKISPLISAEDAVIIDTTYYDLNQSFNIVFDIVNEKLNL